MQDLEDRFDSVRRELVAKVKEIVADPSRRLLAMYDIEIRTAIDEDCSLGVKFGLDRYPLDLSLDQILIQYGQLEDPGLSEIYSRQLAKGDIVRRFKKNERELLDYVRENRRQLLEGLTRNVEKVIQQLRN